VKSDLLRSMIASIIVYMRKNSAWENYELIGGKSPINELTQQLIDKLQKKLPDVYVTQAMRYTPPFANQCIKELEEKNIKDLILLPLYPQYSTTTTKSSLLEFIDEANEEFNMRAIEPFYKQDDFNQMIVNEIISKVFKSKYSDYDLIFSAHGLPQKIVDAGDTYQEEVEAHVEILKNKLVDHGIEFNSINLAYQSKVGPMKWIDPSLDESLKDFKDKKVIIYPISFIIDNSETFFELDIEYREIAQELGIKEYQVCKCANDSDAFVDVVLNLMNNIQS
ncbi:MAG: ferrochelatase, partial [Campylobacteraceae bacterium]|nr:ferrochelatase [Campylobacteraceae bacterium]